MKAHKNKEQIKHKEKTRKQKMAKFKFRIVLFGKQLINQMPTANGLIESETIISESRLFTFQIIAFGQYNQTISCLCINFYMIHCKILKKNNTF